jgi:acetolactate synthase-1/3 small subunit
VSEVDSDKFLSRITIVTSGTKIIVDQIKAQLKKLIPVHNLVDITELDSFIGKELILIKLNVKRNTNGSFENVIKKTKAIVLFKKDSDVIIQFTGSPLEISNLLKKLKSFKVIEQTRSGLVSMALGLDYIKK